MTEIEVPLEQSQEHIMEEAHHSTSKWISGVALSSALLAVIAAISALLAGHNANEAMMEQIQSANRWAYYQSKSIKAAVLSSKMQLIHEMGKKVQEKDEEKLAEYKTEQDEISKEAHEKEASSQKYLHIHETFAKAVTFFQIAIAVAAISVLVKRRRFWFVSLAFGFLGLFFFIQGFWPKH